MIVEPNTEISKNPVELVAIAVKSRGIPCRDLASGQPITFRQASFEVEGEILTVVPSNQWKHGKTNYLAGEIVDSRIDVKRLGLTPLALKYLGEWDPKKDYYVDPEEPLDSMQQEIIDAGPRPEYEMEQVIPNSDPNNYDFDNDPILIAAEAFQCGDYDRGRKEIEKLTAVDLRCLDAHAHLGNWLFPETAWNGCLGLDQSKRHYEVGMKIGELSLPDNFNGLLPWGFIDNRPFLRCMHGYGLCLWRQDKVDEAAAVFKRMIWLNPSDNQGVRFCLAAIADNVSWDDFEHDS